MPDQTREVRPLPKPRHVFSAEGRVLIVPDDWDLLPPGDAALSRRVKQAGPSWTVIEIKRGKRYSHGVWAPAATIASLRADRETEQSDPGYQKKLEASRRRRDREQVAYAEDFEAAVRAFLQFHHSHLAAETQAARLIAAHAVPVGSGTVARTERIPLEERAEAATIAWMRHQTTDYDERFIARRKGERHEVRRELARDSRKILDRYRSGAPIDPAACPLARALAGSL
ncbi:MAG: hypothetical protein RL376_548 [Verrucomicrobiota bacterium]|jgi:hypothetical protein